MIKTTIDKYLLDNKIGKKGLEEVKDILCPGKGLFFLWTIEA